MVQKLFQLFILVACVSLSVCAQQLTPKQYVEKYKDLAIREMKRMGVPAAVTLAQGLLETENGNSDLVKKSNNHFGIKCKSSWTSAAVTHDDDAIGECFRSYKDAEASYRDHSNYLRGNDRYGFLFTLNPTDYKGWARGLRKAGYATNPKYPEILIKNIEQYNLQQYSLEAGSDVPKIATPEENRAVAADEATTQNTQPTSNSNVEVAANLHSALQSINGHKCYVAKKGTSLLAIATAYEIDLSKLLEYNDLETDGILSADQLIFLQRKSKTGEKDYYLVQHQETLYDIAQKNGIQLKYLLAYNQLSDKATVQSGSKLYLSATRETQQANVIKEAAVKTTMAAAPIAVSKPVVKNVVSGSRIHEVQVKEGLYGIAKKYQVTVQQLRDWNNLSNDNLKIGQQLIVSE